MDSDPPAQSAVYSIKAAPGKGLGVFANKDIPKGTRITCEKPLLTAPREPGTIDPLSVFEAYELLTPNQQKTYLALSATQIQTGHALACIDDDVPDEYRNLIAKIASIFESNAFNIGEADEQGITQAGIFPVAARFNHDCAPNVAQTWNEHIGCLTLHTVRHIQTGEELCDSYVPLCQMRSHRQDELQAYGFFCQCSICGSKAAAILESDERRRTVHRLGEDINFFAQRIKGLSLGPISPSLVRQGKTDPLNVIRYIEHLLEEEKLTGHDLIQYYAFATWFSSSQEPYDNAVYREWLQKLSDLSHAIKGADHEETLALEEDHRPA